jgi:hypothetical protein
LFCDILCIVFVYIYICAELLPPGGYPIAVKYWDTIKEIDTFDIVVNEMINDLGKIPTWFFNPYPSNVENRVSS